jgi:GNAT superfamily N-acetyltransferase
VTRKWRPLTTETVDDLVDSCPCCAYWESVAEADPTCGSTEDRERLVAWVETVLEDWGDCGRIAYEDGEVLGFVKYAPSRYLPQVRHMPAGPPSDDAVLLACLHVSREARSAGLGKVLLQAVLRDLATRKERALEAYGAAFAVDRDCTPFITVEFLLRNGFTVVRPHHRYPLLRLEMKSLAAWTDSIEAVLESITLPLRVPERAPQPLAHCAPGRLPGGGGTP